MTTNNYLAKSKINIWKELNWHPSPQQIDQLIELQILLAHLNKQFNLTRLIEGDDYWIGQVFDSIWPIQKELNRPNLNRKIIDVGSGCGFPGLAVAIALPAAKMTFIEATRKKTEALKMISNQLGLSSRISIKNERVEVTGQNPIFRNKYDIAMARAVATDSVIAEYLVPLINSSGEAILFKGRWEELDQQKLNKALKILRAQIKSTSSIQLPFNRGIRHQIRIKAIEPCPNKYPRNIGLPKRKPLGE